MGLKSSRWVLARTKSGFGLHLQGRRRSAHRLLLGTQLLRLQNRERAKGEAGAGSAWGPI